MDIELFADRVVFGVSKEVSLTKSNKDQFRHEIIETVNAELEESCVPSTFHTVMTAMLTLSFDDETLDIVADVITPICREFTLSMIHEILSDIVNACCEEDEDFEMEPDVILNVLDTSRFEDSTSEEICLICYKSVLPLVEQIKDFDFVQFKSMVRVDLVNAVRSTEDETEEPENTTSDEEIMDMLQDEFIDSGDEEYDEDGDEEYDEDGDEEYDDEMIIALKDKEIELIKKERDLLLRELNYTKKELSDLYLRLNSEQYLSQPEPENYSSFYSILGFTLTLMYIVFPMIDCQKSHRLLN